MDSLLWHPFVFGFVVFPLSALMTLPFLSRESSVVMVAVAPVALAALLASAPEIARGVRRLVCRLRQDSGLRGFGVWPALLSPRTQGNDGCTQEATYQQDDAHHHDGQ